VADPALCDANDARGNGTLERGVVEQPQSNNARLLERRPELRKKLYLILPAVGLGVSISTLLWRFRHWRIGTSKMLIDDGARQTFLCAVDQTVRKYLTGELFCVWSADL
jgi:hypothetical protein